MVIERQVTFHVHSGKAQEFASFFTSAYAPAMARQPGFCGAELLRPDDPADTLVMVLRFSGTEAALAWRESAAHKELSPTLKSLYLTSEVRVYDVLSEQPGPDRLR